MGFFNRKQENERQKKTSGLIMTRETFGMVLALFSFLSMLCLITDDLIFGKPGYYVNAFLLGVFGYCSYALVAALLVVGVLLVWEKKIMAKKSAVICLLLLLFLVVFLVHAITSAKLPRTNYGKYIAGCYRAGEGGIHTATAGGVFFALFEYPFIKLLSPVGVYVVSSLAICFVVYYMYCLASGQTLLLKKKMVTDKQIEGLKDYPAEVDFTTQPNDTEAVTEKVENFSQDASTSVEQTKNDSYKILYPNVGGVQSAYGTPIHGGSSYQSSYNEDLQQKIDYIKTPREYQPSDFARQSTLRAQNVQASQPILNDDSVVKPPIFLHGEEDNEINITGAPTAYTFGSRTTTRATRSIPDPEELFGEKPVEESENQNLIVDEPEQTNIPPLVINQTSRTREISSDRIIPIENPVLDEEPSDALGGYGERFSSRLGAVQQSKEEKIAEEPPISSLRSASSRNRGLMDVSNDVPEIDLTSSALNVLEGNEEPRKPSIEDMPLNDRYYAPPIALFSDVSQNTDAGAEDFTLKSEIIESTLAGFNIPAKVVNLVHGPTVTRYELEMPPGISVNKVPPLQNDIAMRLESPSGVLIEAPIPGKNLLGIQVPNTVKATVGMREILQSEAVTNAKKTSLTFVVGKDVVGNPIAIDLTKTPHLLVAGTTGSGKSVCLNCLIVSLIARYSPEELRLILIDPKQVEFEVYAHLPHLMIDEIVSEADKTISVLNWAIAEMERRYTLFRENVVKDIDDYNASIDTTKTRRLPKIVIIVDELSDLMSASQDEIEKRLLRIAQKARSAGIHLVLATQRPSVDVITGVIKANLPSKIAFRVTSGIDSRTILDEVGAEKLLGYGDMLIKALNIYRNVERVQGAYIPDQDVKKITAYIKEHNKAYFDRAAEQAINAQPVQETHVNEERAQSGADLGEEQLFIDAVQSVIVAGQASISMLRRRFGLGYAKAGQLIDKMEQMGYVSPFQGSKSRPVLISQEEFDEKYGNQEE